VPIRELGRQRQETNSKVGLNAEGWGNLVGRSLVIVCAAQVVAAIRADELAAMTDKPVGTGGTNLAMVVNGLLLGNGAARTTL